MDLLLVVSDEHNHTFIGCHGDRIAATASLDSLAAAGADFHGAYCNNPFCPPSRASFTIGDYASRHGYWDNAFPDNGETKGFGHRISEAGFAVTAIGKVTGSVFYRGGSGR